MAHRVDRRMVVVWKLFVFVLLCVCFFECWWTCPPEMSLFLDETDQTGWQNFPKFMVFCFFFGGLESFHAQRFFMRVTFITVFHPMEILDFVEPWLVDTVLILFNTYLYNLDPSPPVTVTRIITFLVVDINLCHFCHCYWVGVDLIYDYATTLWEKESMITLHETNVVVASSFRRNFRECGKDSNYHKASHKLPCLKINQHAPEK